MAHLQPPLYQLAKDVTDGKSRLVLEHVYALNKAIAELEKGEMVDPRYAKG